MTEMAAAQRASAGEMARLRERVEATEAIAREAKVVAALPPAPVVAPPAAPVVARPAPPPVAAPPPASTTPRISAAPPASSAPPLRARHAHVRSACEGASGSNRHGRARVQPRAGDLPHAREHGQAVLDFLDFMAKYPKHPLVANAQYWIGEAYYVQRDYRQAQTEFQKVLDIAPGSAKAGDALLKIGYCQRNLRDESRARATWQRVVHEFPRSEAAGKARTLLSARGGRRNRLSVSSSTHWRRRSAAAILRALGAHHAHAHHTSVADRSAAIRRCWRRSRRRRPLTCAARSCRATRWRSPSSARAPATAYGVEVAESLAAELASRGRDDRQRTGARHRHRGASRCAGRRRTDPGRARPRHRARRLSAREPRRWPAPIMRARGAALPVPRHDAAAGPSLSGPQSDAGRAGPGRRRGGGGRAQRKPDHGRIGRRPRPRSVRRSRPNYLGGEPGGEWAHPGRC